MSEVVTRFAPSPTGFLHIGGARTALFNWLLARSMGGQYILRIEDTDVQRSDQEMNLTIIQALKWLGLDWDIGPIYQSRRLDLYQKSIDNLLQSGKAYYCDCSEEEVETMREEARQMGAKPKYNGKCRELNLGPGPDRVVRFKSPLQGRTVFQDMIKGEVAVDNRELDDFVLRRRDNTPTYNLAVTVDDAYSNITHVLRGDDHLSNTPKQVLLYQALEHDLPFFGHVPMILGPDKKRLSKRHGAMSVLKYREMGYLPEALLNYLVRLGWSYGDQEIFSPQELVEKFNMQNLGKSACVFNPDKLLWVNSQHIKLNSPQRLVPLLQEQLEAKGLPAGNAEYLQKIIPLLQPRAETLAQMAEMAYFFVIPDWELEYDQTLLQKFITAEIRPYLSDLLEIFKNLPDFSRQTLEKAVEGYLQERGIKFKILAQPIRVAISGRKATPGLFETMEILGQQRVTARLSRVLHN